MQTLFGRTVSLIAAGLASAALTAFVVTPFIAVAGTSAGLIA